MSTMRFTPSAQPVTDVWKLVLAGTWAAADTITLTVGLQNLVYTVGTTVTTASIATGIQQMWQGTTQTGDGSVSQTGNNVPQMAEATASIGATASAVLFTMNTAGRPIIISRTLSSGSGTATLTNPTVATGPNFWSDANNWSGGAIPATGDTVRIDNCNVDILYGLAQSGVTLAALYVDNTYTATIGLPERNQNGTDYEEYRAQYLAISATIQNIGDGVGAGSGRIKINNGTAATTFTLFSSGSPLDTDLPAVLWKGTHASNALVQNGGSLGVAVFGGETATLATVKKVGGDLRTGAGVTLSGALQHNGGTWIINSAIATSLTQIGGSATINGTGAVAQLTVQGGNVAYNTTGTLGGATVVSGTGLLDFSANNLATTVSAAIDMFGQQCQFVDPNKRTGSVVIDLNQSVNLSQLNLGLDFRITRAATA